MHVGILLKVSEACAWQDGAEGDGLPDPGELVLLTYTVRCEMLAMHSQMRPAPTSRQLLLVCSSDSFTLQMPKNVHALVPADFFCADEDEMRNPRKS